MGVFERRAKGRVDWTDQDLLTYEEAEERLVELETEITAALAEATAAQAQQLKTRLRAVREIRAGYPGRDR